MLLLGVAAYVLSFNLFRVGNLRNLPILVIFPNCGFYVIASCTKYVDPGQCDALPLSYMPLS